MRAVRIHRHGELAELVIDEVPVPAPAPSEALVRVAACGVNHADLLICAGRTEARIELPRTLGSEVAGEVAAVGDDVRDWAPGARVAVATRLSCGDCEFCRAGDDNVCLESRAVGLHVDGGYAGYLVVPARNLVALPEGLDARAAAATGVAGLSAWHMLVGRARLKAGETLLVIAGGSGVGSFAIQIGKMLGARVIATAGTAAKLALARELGADEAIDHSAGGIADRVRSLTGKRGADVVFEHVGAATWEESVRSLARNGRLVTCGAHTGRAVGLDLWTLFAKQVQLIGSYLGTRAEHREVLARVARGALRPVVHRAFPLAETRTALELLRARGHFGKLVIEPRSEDR